MVYEVGALNWKMFEMTPLPTESMNDLSCFCTILPKHLCVYLPLLVWFSFLALQWCGKSQVIQCLSNIPIKSSHSTSNPVSEEVLKWGQFFLSTFWCNFGQNPDAQQRKSEEEHHAAETWCLLRTIKILESDFGEEAFCKSLRLHFHFK